MEESVLLGLRSLNYDNLENAKFREAVSKPDFTPQFIQIVCWLVSQLKGMLKFSYKLSGEVDTFALELLGLLRDLGCPYSKIIGGNGLQTKQGKLFTLEYLVTELQACRMSCVKPSGKEEAMETDSSAVSGPILSLMQLLNVPMKSNISSLLQDIQQKIGDKLAKLPNDHIQEPLLKTSLNKDQWDKVSQINDAMCQDYKQRRQVLIKRVDVTVQSFCWSDKLKNSTDEVANVFQPLRANLCADSITSIVEILTARTDLYAVEKTSSGASREATRCELNRVLIAKVPDRGGRPSKTAPPPEMPKFMKRVADPPRGGGRGGGRGGYRGGGNRGGGGDGDSVRGRGGRGRGRGGRGGRYDDYQRPATTDDNKMYYS